MAQLFRPSSNTIAKVSIAFVVLLAASTLAVAYIMDRGPWITDVRVAPEQPVYFSHKHHVKDDGIDCRYCHTGVETSHFAGLPPTETCMTCHSQIWSNASVTQPIRDSWTSGKSIAWTRVHDLPDFVYFNHSIHINKGIGCSTCHGQVQDMPWVYKVNTLYMNWCVNCHRNPAQFIRPKSEVFNMDYKYPSDQAQLGAQLVKEYHVQSLTDCTTCHR
ncbi:MAG: cytochrome c3 family protein [Acidobacteriaceae bacterium]|nr:cytochrome c3 family protein [Acidobacteriaceae bacterium]MBV8570167.1 cytochrome c3 family protein [Acidobacteriaceae bacterium]